MLINFLVFSSIKELTKVGHILNLQPATRSLKPNHNVKRIFFLPALMALTITGCSNYPRTLNFPFDNGGRGLNSRSSELNPYIAGNFITFTSDRNGSQDIYLFDARNRRLIDLPGLNAFDEIATNPTISEDGRYLVFMVVKQGQSGLYLYDRTTQQKRVLIPQNNREIRNPMISSNGERIVFETANNGQWDIVVTDIRGNPINN